MILERFYDEPLAQASFLVGCPAAGEAIVIDPNRDVTQYVRFAAAERLRITAVTETHIHADFVSGARELAHRTGARLYLSDEGAPEWSYAYANEPNVTKIHDGDVIRAGSVALRVMKTPGHTPEHVSFVVTDGASSAKPRGVFTGDFVFVGDVGRPDLLERAANFAGTMEQGARTLFASLQRFRGLPDYLALWPGHGAGSACGKALGSLPSTTLGYEKLANWGLCATTEREFVAEVLAGQPEPPAYFKEMKRMNQAGPAFLEGFTEPPRLPAERLAAVLAEQGVVVDLRPSSEFEDGAARGALHIPMGRSFSTWAGSLLPYGPAIHLIAGGSGEASAAARDLAMIGLEAVGGWFDGAALAHWAAAHEPLLRTATLTAAEAWARVQRGELVLVDVRGASEYQSGHVPGARHIPLGALPSRAPELPRDRPVALHCQGGTRSPIAVSVLRSAGFENVFDVSGGLDEWRRAGLPVEDGTQEEAARR